MRYLSVCSGIEAASVAWHSLGFTCVGLSEIDKFPSAILADRFPNVTNFGDMRDFHGWTVDPIDILVGGTPCQSFSVAGLRKGLADPRGNLCLTFLGIAAKMRPRWIVWENVPGVLSSGGGRDFGSFLGALAQLGYGWAYRVLDAKFFGVPQRRRRVFVVGCFGDWRYSAAVLFERQSLCGNSSKSTSSKQEVAKTLRGRANSSRRDDAETFVTHSLRGEGFDASEDGTGRGTPLVAHTVLAKGGTGRLDPSCETFVSCTLPASDGGVSSGMHPVVAFSCKDYAADSGEISPTLRSMGHGESHANAGGQVAVAYPEHVFSVNARQDPDSSVDQIGPLDTDGTTYAMAYQCQGSNVGRMGTLRKGNGNETGGVPFIPVAIGSRARGDDGRGYARPEHLGSIAGTVDATKPERVLTQAMQVRRLTPRECERLQGFPDDWTLIQYRGKAACDGPRYKAIGNSMAVPVMRWIGQRLKLANISIP